MNLPLWRHVRYIDDGVEEYQCLNCEAYFNSRMEMRWEGGFKFCPYCGVKWTGEREWDERKEKYYPHRPLKDGRLYSRRYHFEESGLLYRENPEEDGSWTDWDSVEHYHSWFRDDEEISDWVDEHCKGHSFDLSNAKALVEFLIELSTQRPLDSFFLTDCAKFRMRVEILEGNSVIKEYIIPLGEVWTGAR